MSNKASCKPRKVSFIVRDTDPEMKVVEDDIAKDLAEIGITVQTDFLDQESYIGAERDGSYNLLFTRTWVRIY